jgi:hypothetical protein
MGEQGVMVDLNQCGGAVVSEKIFLRMLLL